MSGGSQETVREALAYGASELGDSRIPNARRDAELLLIRCTGLTRTDLFAHPEAALGFDQSSRYRELLAKRKAQEPIQYILGEREFHGLRFAVDPSVLIPRPETEHLVEAALERIPLHSTMRVADVGTGSGAIAVALAFARPVSEVTALEISPVALRVAESNAAAHAVAGRIRFLESDLLDAVQEEKFDMVVSNPPYIADAERESLDVEVRDYEPATALFAGPTGLEIYERLIPQAARGLRPDGWLLMEIGAGQRSQIEPLLADWREVGFIADLQGIARVVVARAPRIDGPHP
jgi:release factor glutamine methyltransferase